MLRKFSATLHCRFYRNAQVTQFDKPSTQLTIFLFVDLCLTDIVLLKAFRISSRTFGTKQQVKLPNVNLLINNEWVPAASGKTFPTLNPQTEEVITHVAEADAADVNKAVKAANHAFYEGEWSTLSGYERGILLNRLANLIEQNREELAQLEGNIFFSVITLPIFKQIPISSFGQW